MWNADILSTPTLVCSGILLFVAVVIETRTRRIPNWLTVSGLAAGFVVILFDRLWLAHGWGFVIGFGVGLVIHWVGAGLTKLLTAVGTIIGPVVPMMTALTTFLFFVLYWLTVAAQKKMGSHSPNQRRSVRGSLIVLFGTLAGIIVLWKPWE